jgi:hypothetical protein
VDGHDPWREDVFTLFLPGRAKSAINLPLSGQAAVRIVGAFEHVPAYIDRVQPGDFGVATPDDPVTARRINDVDLKSARVIGLLKATDKLTIKPTFMYSAVDASNDSRYFSNLPVLRDM